MVWEQLLGAKALFLHHCHRPLFSLFKSLWAIWNQKCVENTGLALKALEIFEKYFKSYQNWSKPNSLKYLPLYFKFFLSGWHLECRPLDSTLDTSPNFVKEKKSISHLFFILLEKTQHFFDVSFFLFHCLSHCLGHRSRLQYSPF